MADISNFLRLVSGVLRQVDISSNTLVTLSIKVGGGVSNTELTKAILDNLVALQNGSDFANGTNAHTHDGRYFTETELASDTGTSGAELIGVKGTPNNYTPTADNVEGHLAGIDSALASAGSNEFSDSVFRITNISDDTKKMAFDASSIATATVRTITMPDANVNLGQVNTSVQQDGSRAFSADQSMGSNKLTNLADGTNAGDAVNKSQLDTKQSTSEKGQANGYASLDGSGKVPVSQLPSAIMEYKGTWNASTNTPNLADGAGDTGDIYRVSVAGSQDLGSGSISFDVGDYVIYNGTVWEKSDTTDAVASVNGFTGVVVLDTDDVSEGSTNLYHTVERAQDAVGSALINTATINLTYNDGSNEISADVNNNSIGAAKLTTGVFDQNTITGGNGVAAAVQYSPQTRISRVAGESFAANTTFAVRFAIDGETAGRIYKADKDASGAAKYNVVGLLVAGSALTAGNTATVVTEGLVVLGSSDANFGATDIGKEVFLLASGAFSVTAPTSTNEAAFVIGYVEDVNKIYVTGKHLRGVN